MIEVSTESQKMQEDLEPIKKFKVALCMSGQSRFVKKGYDESLNMFLIGDDNKGGGPRYDLDVFIHSWDIEPWEYGTRWLNGGGNPNMTKTPTRWEALMQKKHLMDNIPTDSFKEYFELYKPFRSLIEPQKIFCYGMYPNRTAPGIRSDFGESMLTSMYRANKLKSDYEDEKGFKYDVVVRSRTDIKLFSPIHFNQFDLDKITVPTGCPHPKGIADSFGFSTSKNMDVYCNLINTWQDIMDTHPYQRMCWEELLWIHLKNNNIEFNELLKHRLYR